MSEKSKEKFLKEMEKILEKALFGDEKTKELLQEFRKINTKLKNELENLEQKSMTMVMNDERYQYINLILESQLLMLEKVSKIEEWLINLQNHIRYYDQYHMKMNELSMMTIERVLHQIQNKVDKETVKQIEEELEKFREMKEILEIYKRKEKEKMEQEAEEYKGGIEVA